MGDNFDDDEIEDFGDDYAEDANTDIQTIDIFGHQSTPAKEKFTGAIEIPNSPYLVLARKYRPQKFEDLIGQEIMVKTLGNAFKQNRIAHAFMLTGVRGIGKTTTARLIARALNYSSPGHDAPSMELSTLGINCEAITQGRHPDVLELDAASRSGVENMRELLENVRYGPVNARYKVYIIDEVHMLSTPAFNALLKTLEEPPPHAKFIFATTETQKVPVTILSRCQRFDLRRLERKTLADHLENICGKENIKVDREGLEQISRAAEGSVRDALSLLDQAIVQGTGQENSPITANQVRDMLGLSDRNRIYNLFDKIINANAKDAILELHEQNDYGANPLNIIQSLMELCHETTKLIIMGNDYKDIATENHAKLVEFCKITTPLMLSRMWQMLMVGLDEAKRAPDALQAADMCIIRICGANSLPPPEDLAKILAQNGQNNSVPNIQTSPNNAQSNAPQSFKNLHEIIDALENQLGEVALAALIEKYVKLVRLEENTLAFEPHNDAPKNLNLRISAALEKLNGKKWKVYIEENGEDTIESQKQQASDKKLEDAKNHPQVQAILNAYKGAKIIKITPKINTQIEDDTQILQRKL